MGIRWEGIDSVIAGLTALDARAKGALPEAGVAAMTHIAEVSAGQVPIETGTLLGTQEIKGGEDGTTSVSYGTAYGRYQHDRFDLHHEHGNAGYLAIPMRTEKDTALDIGAEVIGRAI